MNFDLLDATEVFRHLLPEPPKGYRFYVRFTDHYFIAVHYNNETGVGMLKRKHGFWRISSYATEPEHVTQENVTKAADQAIEHLIMKRSEDLRAQRVMDEQRRKLGL